MNIKRINDHMVRCVISEEELQEYGIDMKDLVTQSDRIRQFIEDVIDEAREQAGFTVSSDQLSAQVMAMPSKGLVIVLSESAEENIWGQIRGTLSSLVDEMTDESEKELDTEPQEESFGRFLRSRLEELEKMTQDGAAQENSNVLDGEVIEEKDETVMEDEHDSLDSSSNGSQVNKTRQAPEYRLSIWKFESFSILEQFCASIRDLGQIKSTLYKVQTGDYLLVLEQEEVSAVDMAYVCANAMEFASLDSVRLERKLWLEEHSTVLIRDKAISVLGNL